MDSDPVVLGDELMAIIAGLRRRVSRELRPRQPDPRLRGAQVELLRLVRDQPGASVAAAAKSLHLAANSVSTLVNQLADLGMVLRKSDDADRRLVRLEPTPAAVEWLDQARAARVAFIGAGVLGLSGPDREAIAAALPALRSLLANLDRLSEG